MLHLLRVEHFLDGHSTKITASTYVNVTRRHLVQLLSQRIKILRLEIARQVAKNALLTAQSCKLMCSLTAIARVTDALQFLARFALKRTRAGDSWRCK